MDIVVPLLTLVLLVALGLIFYEKNRRAEDARAQSLARRLEGDFVLPVQTPVAAVQHSAPPVVPHSKLHRRVERWLAQAGVEMSVQQYFVVMAMAGIVGALSFGLWMGSVTAYLLGAGFAAVPAILVALQRKRRLETFSEQLPYVLDFLRSALRAGHTLLRALQMSSENAPEPIGTEIRLALDQMRFGATLPSALESMFKRVPEESLGFFVAAVRVQSEVGSGIAEILDRVADAIRDRQRLQQQLKALTAQSRMSGLIVGAMPFVLLVVFTFIRPDYTRPLFHDPRGIKILETAIVLDLMAFAVIHRMLRLD